MFVLMMVVPPVVMTVQRIRGKKKKKIKIVIVIMEQR